MQIDLIKIRKELVRYLSQVEEELSDENGMDARGKHKSDQDNLRRRLEQKQRQEIRKIRIEKEIKQVKAAVKRIDDGTYGICVNCGKPIHARRLEKLPAEAFCSDCLQKLDGHERYEGKGKDLSMNKETLIKHLNEDLSGEYMAIIQYITYAAKATGPYRPQLEQFFLNEVADEQGHAQFLANKIVALGGEPMAEPREVPMAGSNREMVKAVLDAEKKAIKDYTERAKQAEEFGDKGLVVELEDIVRDETGHYEETERILRDWPL